MSYQYHSERGFPFPKEISGYRNGELPSSVLVEIPFPGKGRLCITAARAFRALQAAHKQDTGKACGTTSAADSYRSRGNQVAAFQKRYRPVYNPLTCTLADGRIGPDGKRWYKKRGVAALAGFDKNGNVISLHGKGVANDFSNYSNSWMEKNASRFGFYKSSPKEPWHYFYTAGDDIPDPVLAYEAGSSEPRPPVDRPTLRVGDTGPYVVIVQKAVGAFPDGQFGPKTQMAVIKFQQKYGLVTDGVVGPQTWALIT